MTTAFTEHVNPASGRFLKLTGRDVHFVEAKGTTLVASDGRTFDDWIAGFGAFNLGHNPPAILDAIRDSLGSNAPALFPEAINPVAGELAEALARATGFDIAHFTNSGSEAVDYAIRTAMRATGRTRVAFVSGAFHGVTFNLHDTVEVPFGDAHALMRDDLAAFIIEPLQMEGGARVASAEYLHDAITACHQHGTIVIFDEVQTGMGRSGQLLCHPERSEGPGGTSGAPIAQPAPRHPPRSLADARDDTITLLAKSLGGGIMPIGAALMSRETWSRAWGDYLHCESMNTTFGGNTLACRAALATLHALDDAFLANVRTRADELFGELRARIGNSPVVARITNLGLMGGIALREPAHPWLTWDAIGLPELDGKPAAGALVVDRLFRDGILAQVCANDWSVVRVEPPLIVSRETCVRFVDAVERAVRWLENNS